MDVFGNASAFDAKRISLTPCAMMARAPSSESVPLRALSAALCHALQISRACLLSRVLVDRNTRCHWFVSWSQILYAANQNGRPR
jgi:hypothetical protein